MSNRARPAPALLLLAAPWVLAACSVGAEESATSPTTLTGQVTSASQGSQASDSDSDTTGDSTSDPTTTSDPTATSTSDPTSDPTSTSDPTATATTASTGSTGDDPCREIGSCTGGETSDSGDVPQDPCANVGDGIYCGGTLGGLADHQSLYQCAAGKTYSVSTCDHGCADNLCNKPPDEDPCAGAMDGNGDYCGVNLPGGENGSLYTCIDGGTTKTQECPDGCQVNPPGTADKCNVADLCQYASSGNGAYCGSSLKPGIADDVLFQCVDKSTQNQQTCSEGCQQMPPGEPDLCKPQQGGDECCLNKPPGTLTQSYTACGNGGSHYGIDLGTPTGTPIYAGITGTVVGLALGYPNCWNAQTKSCSQSCWNAFNYVKVRSDCGDPDNPGNDLYVYYLHIDGVPGGIAKNSHVEQGQLLAYSGNSGCSSGPHIHLETASVQKGQNATLSTCASKDPGGLYCP